VGAKVQILFDIKKSMLNFFHETDSEFQEMMSHFFIKSARTRESQTLERCGRKLLTMPKPEIEG